MIAALWAVLFHSYYLALLFVLFPLIILSGMTGNKDVSRYQPVALIGYAVLILLTYRLPVQELNSQIRRLTLISEQSAEFNWCNRIGIYGLNAAMGLAALPVYPEAAVETLLMTVPQGSRVFHSDFADSSVLVRNIIRQFGEKLSTETKDKVSSPPIRLSWNERDVYPKLGSSEARAALALNGGQLQLTAYRASGRWKVIVNIHIRVAYPRKSLAVLLKDPELIVDEGLFWNLQERGWLHPYEAVWVYEKWL